MVSAEETSTQVEIAFTRALVDDGKEYLLDQPLLDELAHGAVPDDDERVPVLLAMSDNGPQMTSKATAVFMAGARIAQHFGRPGTPNDQAWVESFFGHLKGEFGHLDKITDPGDLEAELDRLRAFWNGTRLLGPPARPQRPHPVPTKLAFRGTGPGGSRGIRPACGHQTCSSTRRMFPPRTFPISSSE